MIVLLDGVKRRILRYGLKKEIDLSFKVKRILFWYKKNGKFCRGRFVEILFYENDSYGCCFYIYKIFCLNSWRYYLREVVFY